MAIRRTDEKYTNLSAAQYNGSARPGELVIDLTTFEVFVGNNAGNLIPISSGGGGNANIVSIPPVYFTATSTGNNQTFSNVFLGQYASASDMTVFYNGALLEDGYYTLSGDTLTVNTPLRTGDSVDIIRQFANIANIVPQYVAIPAIYFTAPTTGNNQTFSNVYLTEYGSASDLTVFYNGVLLEEGYYSLSGDTLTVDTVLQSGDSIGITRQLAGNVGTVSAYGNSNVQAYLSSGSYDGDIIPFANATYSLGNITNQWRDLYLSGNTLYIAGVPLRVNSNSQLEFGGNTVLTTASDGNVNANGAITANGNITANTGYFFIGDGGLLSNISGGYSNANVANYLPTYTGNIAAGNVSVSEVMVANYISANLDIYAGGGISTNGNIVATGNITGNFFIGNGSLLTGITGYSNSNVSTYLASGTDTAGYTTTGNITATNITATGNVNLTAGIVSSNLQVFGNLFAAAGRVLANLTVQGNVVTDNIISETGDLTLTATGTNQNITLAPSGTGYVDVNTSLVKNVIDPVDPQDAATKSYVDAFAQGLQVKDSVVAATTADLNAITGDTVTYNNGASGVGATLTLSTALTTLDGVALTNGDRLLIKNELTSAYNGIYTWATGGTVLTRAADYDTPSEIAAGTFILVQQGTEYSSTGWVQVDDVTTIGTDPIDFTQFSAAGTYTAGAGLTLTGSQFSITNTSVTPGTYGNSTEAVTISVNSRGQITSISQQPAASYGNAEVSAYLASGTDTAGYTTTGDISADNIVASGSVTSLGYAQIVGDIMAFANVSVGDTLFVSGNSIINGNLNLNGRTNVGAINNLSIDGGQPFDVISTDGSGGLSWIPQYSDSDVNNYLSSGADVNLITTGEIIADQASLSSILTDSISVTGGPASLGPVGNVSITGGTNGQVLTTNGSGSLSWTTVGGSGPTYQGIASGNLTAGAPVIATDDGKLSRVIGATQGIGSAAVFNSNEPGQATVVTLTPNGYVAALWPNRDNNMVGLVTIGYINELNGARTWGSTTAFAGPVADGVAQGEGIGGAWDPVNQKLVVAYRDKNNSNRGTVRVGTVDFVTNSVAWGTPVVFSNAAVVWCSAAYDPVSGKVAISYDANAPTCIMGTVTGTSMTFGTATTIAAGRVGYTSTVYDSVNNRIVVTYTRVNSGDYNGPVMAAVGTVSGTSISFGGAVQITGDLPFYWVSSTFDSVNNRVVVSYSTFVNADGNYGYIKAFQVSGSTVTAIGSQVLILGPLYLWGAVCWDEVSGQILMFYATANQNVRVKIYSLVGSTLTATSTVNLLNTNSAIFISAASSDAGGWFTVVFGGANPPNSSASSIGYRAPFNNLTANNFVGFSSANYANAQTATVNIVGSVITNQAGLIPGRKYYVQPSGTLAQTAGTPNVYAGQSVTSTTLIVKG